jgi:hypothetical protein
LPGRAVLADALLAIFPRDGQGGAKSGAGLRYTFVQDFQRVAFRPQLRILLIDGSQNLLERQRRRIVIIGEPRHRGVRHEKGRNDDGQGIKKSALHEFQFQVGNSRYFSIFKLI